MSWESAMLDLESAEDFLDFFGIDYAPAVVHVNRLHILKRYHDYLGEAPMPAELDARRALHAALLARAYADFVASDARTERVFRVFQGRGTCSIPVTLELPAR